MNWECLIWTIDQQIPNEATSKQRIKIKYYNENMIYSIVNVKLDTQQEIAYEWAEIANISNRFSLKVIKW